MPSTPATDSYLRRYAVCVAVFTVALIVFPLLALVPAVTPIELPRRVGNALFFWPQLLLLPSGLQSSASGAVHGATLAPFVAGAFWLIVVAVLARLTLRWHVGWALLALFATAASLAELTLFVIGLFGFRAVLDGL